MSRKTDAAIFILFLLLPFVALLVVGFLLIGEMKWTFLVLGLLPVVFICVGFYARRSGAGERWQRYFEIESHMTETERKQFNRLSLRSGLKTGVNLGLCELSFLAVFFGHFSGYLLAVGLIFLVALPLSVRHQKAVARFLLSTEYAKEKGWETL